jgi:hypothetical protein
LFSTDCEQPPSAALRIAQQGRRTNWALARKMARKIADADYSLKDFTSDLQAFPEL